MPAAGPDMLFMTPNVTAFELLHAAFEPAVPSAADVASAAITTSEPANRIRRICIVPPHGVTPLVWWQVNVSRHIPQCKRKPDLRFTSRTKSTPPGCELWCQRPDAGSGQLLGKLRSPAPRGRTRASPKHYPSRDT